MMRLASVALITALMAGSAPAGSPVADSSVGKIIAREFATWPKEPGAAAVAVRITGRTLFFNEGMADQAMKRPIHSDWLFNFRSFGKVFGRTVLAPPVRAGGVRFGGPGEKIGARLQEGGGRHPQGDTRAAGNPHIRPAAAAG